LHSNGRNKLRESYLDIDAREALFSLALAGRVDASETSVGGGLRKVPSDVDLFGSINTPTRPSLRDGHPPRAFRGGGIRAYAVR
jgi:hypothetical protein